MDSKFKLAGMLVLFGFAYAGYEFYGFTTEEVAALVRQRQGLESEFSAKQADYQRLRAFVQNIESIKGELRELSLQLKSALEYMPPDFKLSELLRRLTSLAQNSGVELVQFNPDAAEQKVEGAFYATTNIAFEIRGAFTQCLLFFDQISRLKRIINIASVNMDLGAANPEERNEKNSATKITTSGTLVTFRFAE
jgi:type IV pilus assembly protein PilO